MLINVETFRYDDKMKTDSKKVLKDIPGKDDFDCFEEWKNYW